MAWVAELVAAIDSVAEVMASWLGRAWIEPALQGCWAALAVPR